MLCEALVTSINLAAYLNDSSIGAVCVSSWRQK